MSKYQTPLHDLHVASGATMIDFGDWRMPLRYTGDKKEHHAVREQVGLFDVSHMGEIRVEGKHAFDLLQYVTCNDLSQVEVGQAQYNILPSENGGFIDDVVIYKRGKDIYWIVVNAANQHKDFQWLQQQNQKFGATLYFESDDWIQLAIQGPHSAQLTSKLTDQPVHDMTYYHFRESQIIGHDAIVSRTGYTGSDGFEIYMHPKHTQKLWHAVLEEGQAFDLTLCGLGARDSLRIEAKMLLMGTDADESTNILEASLGWAVKLDKGDFIGRDALAQKKESGLLKRWVGLEMIDQGIARAGYEIEHEGQVIGHVTSGVFSPTLNKAIALASIQTPFAKIATEFQVNIRGKLRRTQVVKTPFYQVPRNR